MRYKEVKDVPNFFNSLLGFDYRVVADFYDKDGYYIGQIEITRTLGWVYLLN